MKIDEMIKPNYLNKTLIVEGREKIHLGSSSPRRIEMIQQIFDLSRISSPRVDEDAILQQYSRELSEKDPILKHSLLTSLLAKEKAKTIDIEDDEILITADTTVLLEDKILGKPKDKEESLDMLYSLSGKIHYVTTGVCLYKSPQSYDLFFLSTAVKFRALTGPYQKIALDYVESGKAQDKAGAYGIQEEAGLLVEWIYGDYNTIVGLPTGEIINRLAKLL